MACGKEIVLYHHVHERSISDIDKEVIWNVSLCPASDGGKVVIDQVAHMLALQFSSEDEVACPEAFEFHITSLNMRGVL